MPDQNKVAIWWGSAVLIKAYLLNNAEDDLNKTAPLSTCLQQTAGTHPPLKKSGSEC